MRPISFLRVIDDFARIPAALWKETDARYRKILPFSCAALPFIYLFYVLPLFIWERNS